MAALQNEDLHFSAGFSRIKKGSSNWLIPPSLTQCITTGISPIGFQRDYGTAFPSEFH